MKRIFICVAVLLLSAKAYSQTPNKMSYQSVVRNSSNGLVSNQSVGMRISILQGSSTGTTVYEETQNQSTNENGLLSLEIGGGTAISGDFTTIDWANGPYFLKTETDPNGGSNYSISGISQLLSVPYAMYAASAGNTLVGPQGSQGLPGNDGAQGIQGIQGEVGPAGLNGSNGKVIYYGLIDPLLTDGVDGDFYLNTVDNKLFGPKLDGFWPNGISLIGATGEAGPQGLQGPQGDQGPTGLQGPQGLQGSTGANGPQGVQGVVGATGATGPQGVAGTNGTIILKGTTNPSSGIGSNGDFYLNFISNVLFGPKANGTWPIGVSLVGSQGSQGPQGIQGPVGPAGANGSTGPSGFLSNGTNAGNTTYWNGSSWVLNNNDLFNNGGSVGLGTINPNSSAKMEVNSTTQGFLPPRLTTAQRNAIVSPALGLTIYNSSSNCLETWDGTIWDSPCFAQGSNYPTGTVFCDGLVTKVVPALSPATGKIWMDRNLGATRVPEGGVDGLATGDLYQWGRRADGHQCRNSSTTSTLSSTAQPAHGDFIIGGTNWLSVQNDNLWQGVNGVNNPCPSGYRIPTTTEFTNESAAWSALSLSASMASFLKLSFTGYRTSNGLTQINSDGNYWTSTIANNLSRTMYLSSSFFTVLSQSREKGCAIRCIKD